MGGSVDVSYGIDMDKRVGRIAGFLAFVLLVARLGRLMESANPAPAWHVVIFASVFLGGVIWWLVSQTVAGRPLAIGLFSVAGIVLFLRISAAETLYAGFLPTPETFETLGPKLADSLETIRFGLAPVLPDAGVVAIIAVLVWVIGGLFVWGATSGPALAMVLPSFAFYLQLAVMDRKTTGIAWMIGSVLVIGLGVVAVAMERRTETGRVRNAEGRPIARQTQVAAFALAAIVGLGAIAAASTAAGFVPARGNLRWRSSTGYGTGGGGISFDRLADLQQRIIKRTNEVLFIAVLDENAPPANQVYWRMESLDAFDGEAWGSSGLLADYLNTGAAGGDPEHQYRGSSQIVAASVRIESLRMPILPTPGTAMAVNPSLLNTSVLQVAQDGSLIYEPELDQGERYVIDRAVLPLYGDDVAALASTPDGEFTPMFAAAAESGEFALEPVAHDQSTDRPADLDRFVELPEETPLGIFAEAAQRARGATTDFEAAWLLQYWFRDSGAFEYSSTVSTGHTSLDLEAWLTDPSSLNYRTGYCEQFAASMAVMGRAIGIPSRVVWGFTPGESFVQDDANRTEAVRVRDNNAHAWVEMWMDGYGWVQFDPTPRGGGVLPRSITASFNPTEFVDSPDVIEGPAVEPPFVVPGFEEGLGGQGSQSGGGGFAWQLIAIPLLIGAAVALVPWMKRMRKRRRLARLRQGDITAAWDEIVDRLTDLGQPVPAHETPMEFAHRTDDSLVSLATRYSAAVYGGRNGSASEIDLRVAEDWLRRRYESGPRTRAIFNPRSLFDRDR